MAKYKLIKQSDKEFAVFKDDKLTYMLTFKKKAWSCDCPARKACKHLDMLPEEVKVKRYSREELETAIRKIEHLFKFTWEVVGSYRRKAPTSKDIDIIVDCNAFEFEELYLALCSELSFVYKDGGTCIIHGTLDGIPIDIDRVNGPFASHLLYRTGPANLNIMMRMKAKERGFKLSEKTIALSEAEIFEAVGMDYLTPEERRQYE